MAPSSVHHEQNSGMRKIEPKYPPGCEHNALKVRTSLIVRWQFIHSRALFFEIMMTSISVPGCDRALSNIEEDMYFTPES